MIVIPAIILSIQDEDNRVFLESFYLNHCRLMFKTALKIVGDYHIAEDMVSEACVSIIRHVDRLREFDITVQRRYVVSIVRNVSISHVRKRNRQGKYSFLTEDMHTFDSVSSEGALDHDMILQIESEELQRALSMLPAREYLLLKMKYYERKPDTEIAGVLNISTNSVRYFMTRARRDLQKILEGRL